MVGAKLGQVNERHGVGAAQEDGWHNIPITLTENHGVAPGRAGSGFWSPKTHHPRTYSYLSASIGLSLDALIAGNMPLTTPTNPRIAVEAISVAALMVRRMSPSLPFSMNALHRVSDPTDHDTM